jgi:SnoaL-like polyketide cyclase
MTDFDKDKQIIQNFVQVVWNGRNFTDLKDFWTEDCINHAMPSTDNCGIDALRNYHESFFDDFSPHSLTFELRLCSRSQKAIGLLTT